MTSDEIIALIDSGELDKLKSTLEVSKYAYFIGDAFKNSTQSGSAVVGTNLANVLIGDLKQYNPKQHDVHDEMIRKNKMVKGENERDVTTVKVARLSIPEQKKIVLFASTFLGSPSLSSTPAPGLETEMLETIDKIFEDNKLDYKFKDISTKTMSERECAELWYTEESEADYWLDSGIAAMKDAKFKLRIRVLAPSLGDTLYPVYDSYGDMIAFGRYYETIMAVANSAQVNDKTCYFDIYTKDRFYFMTKSQGDTAWKYNHEPFAADATAEDKAAAKKGIPNVIGKIPVIYYSQLTTEWSDVQEMIDRLEKKISNHADTNDYFDSPIVKAKGDVEGFSQKGEQGKVLQMKNDADVSYLTWDSLPESMRLETINLVEFINKYTHTPDISFNNIKGLGQFSGIALKMFFFDAHIKASSKEEVFGQAVQRRINYLKSAVAKLSLSLKPALKLKIKPKFQYFLPKDIDGEVKTLVVAYQAGIISLTTAVKLNPLVEDAVQELIMIKEDQKNKPVPPPPPTPPPGQTK